MQVKEAIIRVEKNRPIKKFRSMILKRKNVLVSLATAKGLDSMVNN